MMPMKLMTAFSNLRNKRESPGHRAETIHHQTCWWAAWTHPGQGVHLGAKACIRFHWELRYIQPFRFPELLPQRLDCRTHIVKTQVWIQSRFGPVAGPGVKCKWYKISQNKPFFLFHFCFSMSDCRCKSSMFNEVKRLDWTSKLWWCRKKCNF